ncbi:MAG: hypothetical protein RLZZ432_472 [Chloroflexota bacterium]
MEERAPRARPIAAEGAERRALLVAARAGDARAFEALFAPDLDLAWRVALRITGEPARADDALQEGLIAAFEHLDRVEPRNLRGWFVRIVQNAARDGERRERRRAAISLGAQRDERGAGEPGGSLAETLDAGAVGDPEARLEGRELGAALRAALDRIPEERRTALLLALVDGYDYAAIAEVTGVSVGTVKSRVSRGRAELRRILAELVDREPPGTAGR